jgi:hypothetical protein
VHFDCLVACFSCSEWGGALLLPLRRPFECPFASEGARKKRLRSQIAPGTERKFPRFSARPEGRIARHLTPIAPDPRLVVGWGFHRGWPLAPPPSPNGIGMPKGAAGSRRPATYRPLISPPHLPSSPTTPPFPTAPPRRLDRRQGPRDQKRLLQRRGNAVGSAYAPLLERSSISCRPSSTGRFRSGGTTIGAARREA